MYSVLRSPFVGEEHKSGRIFIIWLTVQLKHSLVVMFRIKPETSPAFLRESSYPLQR